jgi:pilus assembly protein CpaF
MRISELTGVTDGEFNLEDIYVFRSAGVDEQGKLLGSFYATGHEPVALRRMAGRGVELNPNLFNARELKTGGEYKPQM